jgi:hypothetical protein
MSPAGHSDAVTDVVPTDMILTPVPNVPGLLLSNAPHDKSKLKGDTFCWSVLPVHNQRIPLEDFPEGISPDSDLGPGLP